MENKSTPKISLRFSEFMPQRIVQALLEVFEDDKIARMALSNLPVFCFFVASFETLFSFNEKERKLMANTDDSVSFLETQQIRETLRSSSMGILADSLDIRQACKAYALFNSGMEPQRFVRAVKDAKKRLLADVKLECFELEQFARFTKLTRVEKEILQVACYTATARHFSYLVGQVQNDKSLVPSLRRALFPQVSDKDLRLALTADSWLLQSGIVVVERMSGLPVISDTWLEFFSQCPQGDPLSYFFEEVKPADNNGQVARLEATDAARLKALYTKSAESKKPLKKPLHCLVYGKGNLDRTGLVLEALAGSGCTLLRTTRQVDASDLQAAVLATFKAVSGREFQKTVFLIPKAQQVLTQDKSVLIRELFGIEVESNTEDLVDEKILSLPVNAIWVESNPGYLHKQTLSRFSLHLKAEGASAAEHKAILEKMVENSVLSDQTKARIIRIEGLSKTGLSQALETAERLHRKGTAVFESTLVDLLLKAQKALGLKKSNVTELATTYNLEHINAKGRFAPQVILDAFGRTRKGTLCLYGLPGTGKTQFVRHIAQTLGLPILEYKASQLLSKWLGEAEQNISKMFETAEEQGALLFLDEGDSFLRDRNSAEKSWEVTMVNELLQQMEAFPGIFVLATNLFRNIDEAALRRFVFKLEFMALSDAQRMRMFEIEAECSFCKMDTSQSQRLQEDLLLLRNLTAGDFATVKRQSKMLGVSLTPDEFIEQLAIEVAFKNAQLVAGQRGAAPTLS